MDEIKLIQAAQSGDLEAFNRLVLAYQDLVFNQAYRLLGVPENAEDTTQDAFISAFRNLRSFRGGSFKAWLLRIVTNACYDQLRYHKRHPEQALEPVDRNDEEIESPSWLIDPTERPEEQVERAELNHAIQHCLDNLPYEFKEVVVLVDIQGLDYDEASQVIKKPLGTIKSRLARARIRLQDCLQSFRELLPHSLRLKEEK
jgi:RNA polymerase sigma-70 factor (ECF subfamily)